MMLHENTGDDTTTPSLGDQPKAKPGWVSGVPFQVSYKKAVKQEKKILRKLRDAVTAGSNRRAAQLTREYLRSNSAKLVATVRANKQLKPNRRVKAELIPKIAAGLDPWRGTGERVTVYAKPKDGPNEIYRFIMDFGIENRALQYLILEALTPWAQLHPSQFSLQGGRDAAVTSIIEALGEDYALAAELDIRGCFGSFDEEKVPYLLPLPHEVTKNVIVSRGLNLQPGGFLDWEDPDDDEIYAAHADLVMAEPRLGIPQGSACSDLVTQMLLAPVAHQVPEAAARWFYCDNILVLAHQETELAAMVNSWCRALRDHPAGPLQPTEAGPWKVSDGFDFLGYKFDTATGTLRIRPSNKNHQKFEQEFYTRLNKLTKGSLTGQAKKRAARKLRGYVFDWSASFMLWDGVQSFRDKRLAEIEAKVGKT